VIGEHLDISLLVVVDVHVNLAAQSALRKIKGIRRSPAARPVVGRVVLVAHDLDDVLNNTVARRMPFTKRVRKHGSNTVIEVVMDIFLCCLV